MRLLERLFRKKVEASFFIETTDAADAGPCKCCGGMTRRVWGFVHDTDHAEASYLVEWTRNKVKEHGANLDLIIGRWGEGTEAKDRSSVSLEFRQTDTGPWFTVIDSSNREISKNILVGRALRREDVIGTPLAKRVFDMVDSIWCSDARIEELKESAR